MFVPFSTFHAVGGCAPSATPELAGPRNDAHSRARGGIELFDAFAEAAAPAATGGAPAVRPPRARPAASLVSVGMSATRENISAAAPSRSVTCGGGTELALKLTTVFKSKERRMVRSA